ncbi:MAG: hypothetical protein V7K40_32895 [Nostoc sp.]|uniref:hypothetical protein n=1 Tax=Nostoc sp. TaxID=1180 RepID=UPI002FF7A008
MVYCQNNFKYAFVENHKTILVIQVNLKLDLIREQGISSLEVLEIISAYCQVGSWLKAMIRGDRRL